jgi:hypothetical protein
MNRLSITVVPAVLLLLSLPACTAMGGTGADSPFSQEDNAGAVSDGFPGPSKEVVWNTALRAVREQGYVPDPSVSRADTGRIESRWRLSLSPFASTGYRERVRVRVLDVKGRPGYFRLDPNVTRQMNDNITEPSNPIAADWAQGKRAPEMEALINRRVEMYFLPNDVSPEFRRRYGMPAATDPRIRTEKPKKKEGPIPGLPPIDFP